MHDFYAYCINSATIDHKKNQSGENPAKGGAFVAYRNVTFFMESVISKVLMVYRYLPIASHMSEV
jgi:hypothetical protein